MLVCLCNPMGMFGCVCFNLCESVVLCICWGSLELVEGLQRPWVGMSATVRDIYRCHGGGRGAVQGVSWVCTSVTSSPPRPCPCLHTMEAPWGWLVISVLAISWPPL